MKVLVVDDDSMTRKILRTILSIHAEVQTCSDGEDAVRAYRLALMHGDPFDLVCMDVLMPKMSGIEALELIRNEERAHPGLQLRDTKIIITSGADDRDTVNRAFHGLCDAYIAKPIDTEELIDIVHCLFPLEESRI
jgi:two-component system, chemotaxis family, chemotaxis protein CheY